MKNTACKANSSQTIVNYLTYFEKYRSGGYGLYIQCESDIKAALLSKTISQNLAEQGAGVITNTPDGMLDEIRDSMLNSEEVVISTVKTYKETDVLILNDLGNRHFSYEEIEVLYAVICARYEEMLPTIITTAYDKRALAEAIRPQEDDHCMSTAIVNRLNASAFAFSAL